MEEQTDKGRVMGRELVHFRRKWLRWERGIGLHKHQEVSQGCHSVGELTVKQLKSDIDYIKAVLSICTTPHRKAVPKPSFPPECVYVCSNRARRVKPYPKSTPLSPAKH